MKTRAELIEVMARALAGKGAHHWNTEPDPTDPEAWIAGQRYLDFLCAAEILTAIESNGARVVPTYLSDEMMLEGQDAIEKLADEELDQNLYATELEVGGVYTAMLSANPFKPE